MVNYYPAMSGLSTLHNQRLQDAAILMYKVKNNMCPISPTYISTLFVQPAIMINWAIMTSKYPDLTQYSLLWKALAQVHGPKGMELCS